MGKTFVYNTGSPLPDPPGTLKLTFGVFFDGTLNNLKNTEIRKKVEKKGEFQYISATEEELRVYKKYAKEDNSFGNDFTNVARKYMCTNRNTYSLYIEGIGTIDKKGDEGDGYKYGKSTTGIIGKVRNGCKALAEKIKKVKDKSTDKIEYIELTIDIFGFSRGAAAARNFAYNLQMATYAPKTYFPPIQGAKGIETDHEESEFIGVEKSWIKEGLLPKFGHFGTSLLQAGIPRDLVDDMSIIVRFIGIYDTVASYDPECYLIPDFKKNISKLHLHEIGNPKKAVHFTAADEHRKNFSLTRFSQVGLKTGIERNFPGVHSDIGGSYNHDALSETEFINEDVKPDSVAGVSEKEGIYLQNAYFKNSLESMHNELIEQGWYKKNQLKIETRWKYVLFGTRYLYRGYSFIPLHFMSDYARPYLNENRMTDLKYEKLMTDYALNDDFLEKIKDYLKDHCIEKNEKWTLKGNFNVPDDEVEIPQSDEKQTESSDPIIYSGEIEEVIITPYRPDYLLRKLRNKYLHRSAKLNTITDDFANAPNSDYKRREF